MTVKPYTGYILIKPKNQKEETTESGIILSRLKDEKRRDNVVLMKEGEVLDIAEDVEDIKIGDHIFFNPYDPYGFEMDNQLYLLVKKDLVYAIR